MLQYSTFIIIKFFAAGVLASFGYMEDLCEVTVRNSTAGQWPLFPCTIGEFRNSFMKDFSVLLKDIAP